MRYKVGDKVRVRSDLETTVMYGVLCETDEMLKEKIVTIKSVHDGYYKVAEDGYKWTDEMLEGLVEEELTAEEAIRIQAEMCSVPCRKCPISKERGAYECRTFRAEHPDKVLEILKQWKKDHEKKEVEVTQKIYCLVVNEERKVVHEEEIGNSDSCMDVLKNYCENHDGKFFSLMEFRYEVKQ
nr:MAG TPA: hypothetical protein [Caudoviricetes sp.]